MADLLRWYGYLIPFDKDLHYLPTSQFVVSKYVALGTSKTFANSRYT